VHTHRLKDKPDEIVKMIKAVLRATDYIRTRKGEILEFIEAQWGIKEADIRESIYREMVDLYSRTGIASDETMKNVVQLVRDTRKSKDDKTLSDVFDWSFAKKAQAELKTR
jgi:ABC-type nitrate/sulfonate/bicarbonate transport system substrate-binding protein